jgi:hypothetical protein
MHLVTTFEDKVGLSYKKLDSIGIFSPHLTHLLYSQISIYVLVLYIRTFDLRTIFLNILL